MYGKCSPKVVLRKLALGVSLPAVTPGINCHSGGAASPVSVYFPSPASPGLQKGGGADSGEPSRALAPPSGTVAALASAEASNPNPDSAAPTPALSPPPPTPVVLPAVPPDAGVPELPADPAIPLPALERPLPDETMLDEPARLDALLHAKAFIAAHKSQKARRSTCIAVADVR